MSRKDNVTAYRSRQKQTGLCQVYICHSVNFHGHLRPCYDSGTACEGELTDRQVSTLRSLINRYVGKCLVKKTETTTSSSWRSTKTKRLK